MNDLGSCGFFKPGGLKPWRLSSECSRRRPSKSPSTSGEDPCRFRNLSVCERAYGKRTLDTKSMGVVVPSISKRIARSLWSSEVTTESHAVPEDKKAPDTPAGSCDQARCPCSEVSSLTGLETNESRGLFGLRKDQTNARSLGVHESNLPPLPRLRSARHVEGECETIRGHG